MQGDVLTHRKDKRLSEESHPDCVKLLSRVGLVPASAWKAHAVGRARIDETDGSSSRPEGVDFFLVLGSVWSWSRKRRLLPWQPRMWQRELLFVSGTHFTKKHEWCRFSRGPDVETGDRICRSCHVRDPRSRHQVATVDPLMLEGQVQVDMTRFPKRNKIDLFGGGQRSMRMQS